MSLSICVIIPEKTFLNCETNQVILPTTTGNIGILANHAPLVTLLDPGVLRYEISGNWIPSVIYSGFAQVANNQVIIIVKGAEEIFDSKNFQEVEKAFNDIKLKLEKLRQSEPESDELTLTFLEMRIAKARLEALRYLKYEL